MELNIKDFDDLENYFKRKAQHVEELEHENTELTIENRKLQRKVDELQLKRKSPADTEDSLDKYLNTSIPDIFKGREQ